MLPRSSEDAFTFEMNAINKSAFVRFLMALAGCLVFAFGTISLVRADLCIIEAYRSLETLPKELAGEPLPSFHSTLIWLFLAGCVWLYAFGMAVRHLLLALRHLRSNKMLDGEAS